MKNVLPVIEVNVQNIDSLWPVLKSAISKASFIGIDCELSGLGDRSDLRCSEIDIRYMNLRTIAQKYSIVSLGLSCFQFGSHSGENGTVKEGHISKNHNYSVQTFNILTLCEPSFEVESICLKFLVSHGFDFNELYSLGLPYSRVHKPSTSITDLKPTANDIFKMIVKEAKPIVFHNGFIDLIFLYQSFYADLPKSIETFAADLSHMFPNGIFDTKFLAEFDLGLPASFLEYVFRKRFLENDAKRLKHEAHCTLSFPINGDLQELSWYNFGPPQGRDLFLNGKGENIELCSSFKFLGFCPNSEACPLSHDIYKVIQELDQSNVSVNRKKKTPGAAVWSVGQLLSSRKHKMEEKIEKETKRISVSDIKLNNGSSSEFQRKINNDCSIFKDSDKKESLDCNQDVQGDSCPILMSKDHKDGLKIVNSVGSRNGGIGKLDQSRVGISDIMEYNSSNLEPCKSNGKVISNVMESYDSSLNIQENFSSKHQSKAHKNMPENTSRVVQSYESIEKLGKGSVIISDIMECSNSSSESMNTGKVHYNKLEALHTSLNVQENSSSKLKSKELKNFPDSSSDCPVNVNSNTKKSNGHSAGYDAFMTGYILATKLNSLSSDLTPFMFQNPSKFGLQSFSNKVYLLGKDFPFLVKKSTYGGGTSSLHDQIIKKIRKT